MLDEITLEKARRWKMLQKLEADRGLLAGVKEYYRTHPGAFTNDWLTTYNPEVQPSKIPFNLFKRQWELYSFIEECFVNREDGLIDKTRNMGVTWCAVGYSIEKFLFFEGFSAGFGSRKENLVDKKGDPSSIFEKIRIALNLLPPIFKPKGYDPVKHARYQLIINPENDSFIFGEAGDNIGRGARSSIFFLDEAAHIERSEQVDAALSETSQCKINISTPHGMDNTFFVKRHSGEIKIFSMPWTDDPRKTQAWYDKKKRTTDPVIFAQEYDLDYAASLTNVVIPANWVRAAVNFDGGEPSGIMIAGLDVADGGSDKNALAIRESYKVHSIEAWHGHAWEAAQKTVAMCDRWKIKVLNYDAIGVGAAVRGAIPDTSTKTVHFEPVYVSESVQRKEGYISESDNFNSYEYKLKKDFYRNVRAMLWWELRGRFEKTYQHVNKIKEWPIEDLISIPNDAGLITELSTPTYKYTDGGKIQIQAKADMKIQSPNKADALMLSFYPIDPGPGIYIA
jgi:hypothetical protein